MSNNVLEKEFHKPYYRTIFLGLIISVLLNCLSGSKFSFISINEKTLENIFLLSAILSIFFFVTIPIAKIISNKNLKKIRKIQEELALTDEIVLNEFLTADKIGKLNMSNNFTFIKTFFDIKVIVNRDIVWIFEKVQINNGKKNKQLVIRTIDKKEYKIQIYQEKNARKCFQNYSYYKHIIIGYDKELDKLYQRNFNEFLNEQYYKQD